MNLFHALFNRIRIIGLYQCQENTRIAIQQLIYRIHIDRNTALSNSSFLSFSAAHFHRSVKRQHSLTNLLKNFHCSSGTIITLKHFTPECQTRQFNLSGKIDFLFTRQQGDFAHLRQIHPYWIVDLTNFRLYQRRLKGTIVLPFSVSDFVCILKTIVVIFRGDSLI